MIKRLGIVFVLSLVATPVLGQIEFRQNNTALPPFGGFVPGNGATLTASRRNGLSVRQGSFSVALPPFGGYVPGSDATLSFSSRRRAPNQLNRSANRQQNIGPAPPVPLNGILPTAVNQGDNDARRSILDARRRRAAEKLWKKGQKAEATGNLMAARSYYQRALKYDSPDINEQVEKQLAVLD